MTSKEFETIAPFKFTFPIQKAEERSTGKYLIGMAAGPGIDSQGERVHPTLIAKWADYINSGGEVIYRDWHNKNSSAADLGQVTKAWVTDDNHLGVEVMLDEDNPTAMYIWKKAKQGKQFGMSVFGNVRRYADEWDATVKKAVRTFYDATLEEVSNTTRPIYTPSLGTVLAKAVMDADEDNMSEEVKTPAEPTGEAVTTETTTTEAGAATAPDTGKAPEVADGSADSQTTETTEEVVVEKAVKGETKKDDKVLQNIVKNWKALGTQLEAAGLLSSEEEKTEETTVQKSETEAATTPATTPAPEVVQLSKSVAELAGIVSALADRIPDDQAPGVIRKAHEKDAVEEIAEIQNPLERLKFALAAKHGDGSTLR
jgi:hypothetical protein